MQEPFSPCRVSGVPTSHPHGRFQQRGQGFLLVHRMSKEQHGLTKTPEYGIWKSMKQRCFNKNAYSWPLYGGRGISVCREWVESFSSFLAHIGPRPSSALSVDRIDNDGDYEPGNVRWATPTEQTRNSRHSPDMSGKKFGLLIIEHRIGRHGNESLWQCLCNCGNRTTATRRSLVRGDKKSCGCARIRGAKGRYVGISGLGG